ncbi:hypothetical protein FAVG1_10309 [Fusarium avenaceum]|nr:hypothetical protein FAVG1_10309 [Fusarium avenaceum]
MVSVRRTEVVNIKEIAKTCVRVAPWLVGGDIPDKHEGRICFVRHFQVKLPFTMSHLRYYAYDGQGAKQRVNFYCNQAVRVGDRIECSGQGGWHPYSGEFEKEINAQIDLAFANVERCLKDAGGKGWTQVFRVNSYHVPINDEALDAMVRNFKKWMPSHQPLWTCVGVSRLGKDDMRVEIEVVAHDPEGATAV